MRGYSEENWTKIFEDEKITIFENPKNKLEIKGYKGRNIYHFFSVTCCNSKVKNAYIEKVKGAIK